MAEFERLFHRKHGGIGRAPKFPHPAELNFCLVRSADVNDEYARGMVRLTLTKMAQGGIFDQLGGGFCRYSVDQTWTIPHFEKMLYDNGPLLSLYSDLWLLDPQPLYQRTVADTAAALEIKPEDEAHFQQLVREANALGVPVNARLVAIYTIAAAYAGAAGALLAQTTAYVSLEVLEFNRSADVMLALIIGGTGWLYGGIAGAVVFKILQDTLASSSPQFWMFWLGLFLVALAVVGRDRLSAMVLRTVRR